MMRLSLVALCAMLLAGCDFVGGGGTPFATIADATLLDVPFQQADGSNWDDDGAPDLYVEIQDGGGRTVYRSEVYENTAVLPDGGLDLGTELDIMSERRSYYVLLLDADPDGLQTMARSNLFDLSTLQSGADGRVLVSSADQTLQVELRLDS